VGALGDAGCFSLHPLKTLNACGDAGVITTNDESLYRALLELRNIGLKNRNESDRWGFNSRLDTLQAAILNVKFSYLDSWNHTRRQNALYYAQQLKDIVAVPQDGEKEFSVYHTFVIQADLRDELQNFLEKNGVGCKIHYPIPIHLQKAAKGLYQKGDFPVTEAAAQKILSLPVYQGLTTSELEHVVSQVRSFFKSKKK
jgi:dTDP-4-amino-4,6-dideoxygalactose transaminase